jgi:hypothetical protein
MRNRIKSLFFTLLALLAVGAFGIQTSPLLAASGSFDVNPGRVVFSAVKTQTSGTKQVTIVNTTGSTISITELAINNGKFALQGAPGTPFNISGNGTQNLNLTYSPTAEGVDVATLTVTGTGGSEIVELRGLGTDGTGGNNEPSLQLIFDAWNIALDTGDDDKFTTPINSNNSVASSGLIPGSDEVTALAFQRANPAQPVTLQPLAIFGVNTNPDVRVGTYTPGDPDSKAELFNINCCSGQDAQILDPSVNGTTSFSPSGNFSFYSFWPNFGYNVYQESTLNTWEDNAAERYKVRIYPMPGEANAYIFAVEEFTSGFDYNDVVVIVRNIAPAAGGAGISFENRDWVTLNGLGFSGFAWMNRWLTFSKIRDNVPGLRVHNTVTLRIKNSGAAPITVSNISFDDPSNWTTAQGVPFNVPVGGFVDVPVQYIETSTYSGARYGKMFITSNAPNEPNAVINLGAGYQQKKEGQDELQVQWIIDSFGFKSFVDRIPAGSYNPAGEEIMAKYWSRADGSKPIYVRELASFHGCCSQADTLRIKEKAGPAHTLLASVQHDAQDGQSYLPFKSGTSQSAEVQLSPSTSNKFYLEVNTDFEACEPDTTSQSPCSTGNLHGLRIWPARDPYGAFIPNAYIFSMDFVGNSSVNYDYNDNVYLITNIVPETQANPDLVTTATTLAPATTVGGTSVFRFDVRNIKPFNASNVNFTINLPSNATFISQSNAQCNKSGLQISCGFGSNFMNNDQSVYVTLQATGGTSLSLSTSLSTSTTEIKTNNNNVTVVLPILSAPRASNDGYTAQPNTALTVDAFSGVLTNDLYVSALTSNLYGAPRHGTVTLNTDGSFVYTPNAGFNGEDSFTYVVNAGDGTADLGTVNLTIGTASANLLADGSFEAKQNGVDSSWKVQDGSKDKDKCSKPNKFAVAYEGECAFTFTGSAAENSKISQNIKSDALVAGETLALSGMFKAEALADGAAEVKVKVVYNDGTKDKQEFAIAGGTYDYTAFAQDIAINGTVKKIKLSIAFKSENGKLWVDLFSASVGGVNAATSGQASFGTTDDLAPLPQAPGFGSNQP